MLIRQHSDESPRRINILTLNCWGLKFISKYRRERLLEIGRRLANGDYPPEIVGLQECWTQEDYNAIRNETRHILPYGKFYYSGIFGGGLAILSKWPIEESNMLQYPLNGRPTAFFRGDWFVGKGVAYAKIRLGSGPTDLASVYCTHLHAPYEREPRDSYLCHRTAQAWEIAKLMRGAAEKGHLVIGMGDFNMLPSSLAHQLISARAPVRDVWQYLHPDSSLGAAVDGVEIARKKPIPSATYNLSENGATCDGILNTWRWDEKQRKRQGREGHVAVDGSLPDPRAKRLDYIFVGGGGYNRRSSKWNIRSARVGMTERHPTLHCSLSDHFSVEATVVRDFPNTNNETEDEEVVEDDENIFVLPIQNNADGSSRSNSLSKFPNAANATASNMDQISLQRTPSLTADVYNEILFMISKYVMRERFQRKARLGHFVISLFISIGCLIGIWWTPYYVSFVLCLVSTLNLSAGVLDGLIGGLFVSSELRALKEFEWEVKNARRIALGMGSDIE